MQVSEDGSFISESGSALTTSPTMQQYLATTQGRNVKEAWISNLLKTREQEFSDQKELTILLGTWNVNGRKPGESLDKWLIEQPTAPDIYAIGFQELDLSAENFLLGSTPLEALWAGHIEKTLKSSPHKYVMLETKRLVGILLFIFVKEEHLSHIRDVQTGVAAVGIMGMMGNKGGVAIRFNFYDSTFCIVNCHLNAHLDGVTRRNQDYHDISRRILFSSNFDSAVSNGIFDHDFLFWIGDLNYRVTLNDAAVRVKIQEEDWSALWEHDQLLAQMKADLAFGNFTEMPLKFPPTYKYDVGTNTYDTSDKSRTPAWCDRVLWRGTGISQTTYQRHELLSSDHKPVSALCDVKVKHINAEKRHKVYQDIVRLLDRAENESRPAATIDKNTLDFGEIRFGVPTTQSIVIENTGKVLAKYQFIPKLDERTFCRAWMFVSPSVALLIPGEKAKINFTVLVDKKTALDFNMGRQKPEDILILHLDGGIDHFISLTGKYLTSCFGTLLSHLIRYPGPVRTTQPLPENSQNCLSIPKELWRIIDYIYRKGMEVENLFLESGVEQEMEPIRECLDTGESFDSYSFSPHSMAETLIRFLDSFGEPVIPFILFDQAVECPNFSQSKILLNSLPNVHYNTFYYIIAFLRELLTHAEKNNLTADKLAVLFSSVILRRRESQLTSYQTASALGKKRVEFIEQFLKFENELSIR